MVDLLKQTSDEGISEVCFSKLRSQGAYAQVAKHARLAEIKERAVKFLDDQTKLADVAIHVADWKAGRAAVQKLESEADLIRVARLAKWASIGEAAAKKISDQSVSAELAIERAFSVVKNISDERLLLRVAGNTYSPYIRNRALDALSEQSLRRLASDKSDPDSMSIAALILSAKSICEGIPEQERREIIPKVFDLLRVLAYDEVKHVFGDCQVVVSWEEFSVDYLPVGSVNNYVKVTGDRLICSIRSKRKQITKTVKWSSEIPKVVNSTSLSSPEIHVSDVLVELFSACTKSFFENLLQMDYWLARKVVLRFRRNRPIGG